MVDLVVRSMNDSVEVKLCKVREETLLVVLV